jgi:hypothetical protein
LIRCQTVTLVHVVLDGDPEQKTWGNTAFFKSADTAIREMSDLVLPDTRTLVIGRQMSSPDLSPVEAKRLCCLVL